MLAGWLPRLAGLSIGVLAAALVAGFRGPAATPVTPAPVVLSECDGVIGWVAIHYTAGMDFVWPTYRALLAALPAEVKVTLVCPRPADRDELLAAIGQPASRFAVVLTGHAMTGWSRDRWVTLAPATPGGTITLIPPTEELAADVWAARAGDSRLAFDLAAGEKGLIARRSRLIFDGGDFLSDGRTVFVSPAVLERNLHVTVSSEAELLEELRPLLGRKIVMLRNAPPHHVGMYMAIAGDGVAVVGDPSLGQELLTPTTRIDPDWNESTQKQFDDVAAQLSAVGYQVVRIPTVVAPDGKTYLTFVNGLIDQRPGGRVVYLPTYAGQDALNVAAGSVWKNLGYQLVPIDCTGVFPHFGTLHCLVNVMQRNGSI